MTFRTLFLGCVLFVTPALAGDGGLDGGDDTPDASAGNGGADQMTQEGDEPMPNGPCSLSRDCQRGFACVSGMCRYTGYRQATQGCNAAPAVLGFAALVMLRRALTARRSSPGTSSTPAPKG